MDEYMTQINMIRLDGDTDSYKDMKKSRCETKARRPATSKTIIGQVKRIKQVLCTLDIIITVPAAEQEFRTLVVKLS